MKMPHTPAMQTPFDSVENAQAYIQLLIETLVEAKKEVADDAAREPGLARNGAWKRFDWWNTSCTGWSTICE
jgi:hypothetical protein